MSRIFIRPKEFQLFCHGLFIDNKKSNIFYDQVVYNKNKKSDGYATMFVKDMLFYLSSQSNERKVWTEDDPCGKALAVFYRENMSDAISKPRGVKNIIVVVKNINVVNPQIDTSDLIDIPLWDIINNERGLALHILKWIASVK
jgi:hypothetical protein